MLVLALGEWPVEGLQCQTCMRQAALSANPKSTLSVGYFWSCCRYHSRRCDGCLQGQRHDGCECPCVAHSCALGIVLPQQPRQLGDIRRDPPRLIARECWQCRPGKTDQNGARSDLTQFAAPYLELHQKGNPQCCTRRAGCPRTRRCGRLAE